jgi:hypothetical protein
VAISLLTSSEIKNVRLQRVNDIVDFVPNADVKDALPGFSQVITIRGVGQNDFGFLNTSSVGVYVDEVNLASPGQFGFLAFDLERVCGRCPPLPTTWKSRWDSHTSHSCGDGGGHQESGNRGTCTYRRQRDYVGRRVMSRWKGACTR